MFILRLICITYFYNSQCAISSDVWLEFGTDNSAKYENPCDHEIFCETATNWSIMFICSTYCGHNYDPITYSSLKLLSSPKYIRKESETLFNAYYGRDKMTAVKFFSEFFNQNFDHGGELEQWTPMDFTIVLGFIARIVNRNVRSFAMTMLSIWPQLGWKVADNLTEISDRHSIIPLPNGFIGLSNDTTEWRYFDSYWILEGLLISRMFLTAQGMLDNMVYLIKEFGFIPSASRLHYKDRSGPPVLAKMVALYANVTNDFNWVKKNLDVVAREMKFWKENRFSNVEKDKKIFRLAQYKVRSRGLRLENIKGDFEMTEDVKNRREEYLNEFKSAAESGWLFSSRWIFNKDTNASSIDARDGHPRYTNLTRVIPVDLNALIYGAFDELANLYMMIDKRSTSAMWRKEAEDLLEAIEQVLWNEEDGTWYDYDLQIHAQRRYFYASNLVPLWTKAYRGYFNFEKRSEMGRRAVSYLTKEEVTQFDGGIPASMLNSDEEWDFPNAWPSSQMMIIDGLRYTGNKEAWALAEKFATKFLQTTHSYYRNTKQIAINYDVTTQGGVHYIPKSDRPLLQRYGYASTNAVVLAIIQRYVFPYGTLVRSSGTLCRMMYYLNLLMVVINLSF